MKNHEITLENKRNLYISDLSKKDQVISELNENYSKSQKDIAGLYLSILKHRKNKISSNDNRVHFHWTQIVTIPLIFLLWHSNHSTHKKY